MNSPSTDKSPVLPTPEQRPARRLRWVCLVLLLGIGAVAEDDIEPTFSAFDHPRVLIYRRRTGTPIEALLGRWKRVVIADRRLPDFYILNGVRAFHQADWDGALRAFQQALKVRPDFALAHLLMGEVHRKQGNFFATEQAWKRAAEVRGPVTIHSHNGMASAGLKAEAVVHIDYLAHTHPDRRDIARLAASLYFELAHEHQKHGRTGKLLRPYAALLHGFLTISRPI